ncbi:hypothetical protein ACI6PS_09940 [Flavobacterium sp. PLA-1-15]|uniref:hypothetical protein n=1 Tax=Flavobacterium sp. PLA-1-15 TaxID=3380533 RepID=UPI003B7FEB73
MKTRLIKNVLGILFVLGTFTSCSLDDGKEQNCSQVIGASTLEVTGPTEAAVNEEITLTVSYKIASTCGDFYAFNNQTVNATEKKIGVLVTYDVCNCDNVLSIATEPYKFKVATAGVYKLKFAITNEVFLTHTVTVE